MASFCLYFEVRPRGFPYRLRWDVRERKKLRMTGVFVLNNWKARRAAGRAVYAQGKVRGSVLGTRSWRCLPATPGEMLSGRGCVSLGVGRQVRAGAGRALKLGWGSPQGGLGSTHALPESGLSRLQELLKDPLLPQFSHNLGWIGTLLLLPSPGRPHLKAACP